MWLSAVPYRLNGTELSQEESWDNLHFRYGLMHQEILTTCNGCGKRLLIEHAISCLKGGLVMTRNDEAAKEWSVLGAQALVPSVITYKHKINNRTVRGERIRAGARQESGTAGGAADIL